jgi:hypothetical protein
VSVEVERGFLLFLGQFLRVHDANYNPRPNIQLLGTMNGA